MEHAPRGIANLGNTCYINSCIQILCQIPIFTKVFQETEVSHPTKIESLLWKNYKNVLDIIHSPSENLREEIHPNGFIQAIEQVAKHKKASFYQQDEPADIGEFFIFLIDSFHECISREMDIHISGHSENEVDNLAIEVFTKFKKEMETNYSPLYPLFHGWQVSRISSLDPPHLVHSNKAESFKILDLPIPMNIQTISLQDCLQHYIQPEILDGNNQWYNEKTQQHESIRKELLFWSFPDILIVSLKRNQYDGTKNNTYISYPLELDLRSYVHGYKKSHYEYDLRGVVNHMGNASNGHFNAFVKKQDHWFYCNDETIQIIENLEHLQTKYAHCLIYVKKNSV